MERPTRMKARTPQRRGFSLLELLVVIGMIMLLMTLVAPNLYKYWVRSIRMKCQSNVSAIVKGMNLYSTEGRLMPEKLTTSGSPTGNRIKNVLPNTAPTEENWAQLNVDDPEDENDHGPGNACGLWLLIEEDFTSASAFLCPEASHQLDFDAPDPETANGFTYEGDHPLDAKSTLSYSMISLVGSIDPDMSDNESHGQNEVLRDANGDLVDNEGNLIPEDGAPVYVEILRDYNPSPVAPFAEITTLTSPYITTSMAFVADMSPRDVKGGKLGINEFANSYNHDQAGQNVGRKDLSVNWMTDPQGATGDDIYAANTDLAVSYDPDTGMPLNTDGTPILAGADTPMFNASGPVLDDNGDPVYYDEGDEVNAASVRGAASNDPIRGAISDGFLLPYRE